MPADLVAYISQYGYLTIFVLVFLQEIGVPNPVPNELVLLFSGYLTSIGELTLFGVLTTVILADFIGTALLYFVFYNIGHHILKKERRFIPREKINRVLEKLKKRGQWGIYLGRLIPYLRGYTSVAAGLLRIEPQRYLTAVFLSAITWSGGYAIAGRLLGARYESVIQHVGIGNILIGAIILLLIIVFVIPRMFKLLKKEKVILGSTEES